MIGISSRVLLSISLVIVGVGLLDAFIGGDWDLFVVFALSLVVQAVVWFRHRANRTPVTLRPDLASWIERESQRTGEPFDDVADRAIAWYRHGLFIGGQSEG